MRTIMTGVTDGRGTGSRAAVPGYTVAGKTGTARKPDLENGGYLENSWVSTFAGFAPAGDPEVTVVVVIDDPRGEYYGGLVAAPVFQEIAEHAMRMLRVSPDAPIAEVDDADG
jgi:cell division protein FtsI/penicillin-binding protein 2